MDIKNLTHVISKVQGKKLALCEAEDKRVQEAAQILERDFSVSVTLLDRTTAAKNAEQTLVKIKENLQKRGKEFDEKFHVLAKDSLYEGGALLALDKVDAVVGGCNCPTADVIKASLNTIGLKPSVRLITSAFLLSLREPTEGGESFLVFSDCGVIPDPLSTQLVDIAFLAQEAFAKWCAKKPKIAFLSFSTQGSASHPLVTKMQEASRLFKEKYPTLDSAGEMQFDAAVVPAVSQKKFPGNPLQGQTNVFVFPNLDAGNISYKIAQRLGQAQAWGPVLLGTAKPFSDLSRGANASDIVYTSLLTLALS